MSASRVGDKRNDERRARTSRVQTARSDASFGVAGSDIFVSCDPAHGLDESGPRLLLLRQHATAFGGDFVKAAAPLVGFFDPRPLDPAAFLEAIEQRIKRIDMEGELA